MNKEPKMSPAELAREKMLPTRFTPDQKWSKNTQAIVKHKQIENFFDSLKEPSKRVKKGCNC